MPSWGGSSPTSSNENGDNVGVEGPTHRRNKTRQSKEEHRWETRKENKCSSSIMVLHSGRGQSSFHQATRSRCWYSTKKQRIKFIPTNHSTLSVPLNYLQLGLAPLKNKKNKKGREGGGIIPVRRKIANVVIKNALITKAFVALYCPSYFCSVLCGCHYILLRLADGEVKLRPVLAPLLVTREADLLNSKRSCVLYLPPHILMSFPFPLTWSIYHDSHEMSSPDGSAHFSSFILVSCR